MDSPDYTRLDDYELRYLPSHLIKIGDTETIFRLLVDIGYLEARIRSSSLTSLLNDFAAARLASAHQICGTVLLLIEEGIRREADLIRRRPSELFPSLWNVGWSYGAESARPHYVGGADDVDSLTGQRGASAFRRILNRWRDRFPPDRNWMRAVRPPLIALGVDNRTRIQPGGYLMGRISIASDGSRILGAVKDTVYEWDLLSGEELRKFGVAAKSGETNNVLCTAYDRDASRIFAGYGDGAIRVWSSSGGLMETPSFSADAAVIAIAVLEDQGRLVGRTSEGTMWCWNLEGGDEIERFATLVEGAKEMIPGWITPIASRGLVLYPTKEGSIRAWDVLQRTESFRICGHDYWVRSGSVSLSESVFVSCADRKIRVWDLDDISEILCVPEEGGAVGPCAISPDSSTIAYAHKYELKLVCASTGQAKGSIPLSEFTDWIEFSPDGKRIIVKDLSGSIVICNTYDQSPVLRVDNPEGAAFGGMAFSPAGDLVATADGRRNVRLWVTSTGISTGSEVKVDFYIKSLSWSADGGTLALAGTLTYAPEWWEGPGALGRRRSRVALWMPRQGTDLVEAHLEDDCDVWAVGISADGMRVAVACDDYRILLYDKDGDDLRRSLVIDHERVLTNALAFSPDGNLLACTFGYHSDSSDAWVDVWHVGSDVERLREAVLWQAHNDPTIEEGDPSFGLRMHRLHGLRFAAFRVQFSEDGKRLGIGSRFEPARVWDLSTGECIRRSYHPTDVPVVLSDPSLAPFEVVMDREGTTLHSAFDGSLLSEISISIDESELPLTDPTTKIWAIPDGPHLFLFSVEGPRVLIANCE